MVRVRITHASCSSCAERVGVRVRVRVRARVRVRVRVKRGAPSDRNTLRLDEPLHRGKVAARARHDKLKGLLVRV